MYDFAIVGAGSTGCVLANRLSEKYKVALIEAGPPKHHSLKVRAPGMYIQLWRGPLDWNFTTVPQKHVNDREMYWPRGRVIGGTGSFNTLIYIRGHRDNYDEWRDLGNPGWGYSDVLPYFKKSEDNERGASEFHAAGGPLAVHDLKLPAASARDFVEAIAARCKLKVNEDFNGAEQEGAGYYQINIRNGLRVSPAIAFLDPIRKRENLTVITDALATSLALDGDRVTGVKLRVRGSEQTIEAKETIVCGGAIGSPHLLLLSGIGPADELRAAGVEPKHELGGVGKHLEDHLLVGVSYKVTAKHAARNLTARSLAWWALQHLTAKAGPMGMSPVHAGAFVKMKPDAPRPDNQFHFVPFGTPLPTDKPRGMPWGRSVTILPGLIYPKSSGSIRLRSADPAEYPAIDPNYFSDRADLEFLVDSIKLSREIAATAPLSNVLGAETAPGPDAKTDDDLRAFVLKTVNTIFHPTGTCKMGPAADKLAVVDPTLRVHGLRGLRVADASIMPRIIGGNTNAPCIMIGEKASDLALADISA